MESTLLPALRRRCIAHGAGRPLFALAVKMGVEEADDAAAGVHGGGVVVAHAGEAEKLEKEPPVVVHEAVAGIGVFLYVVRDEGALQGLL